VVDVVEHLLGMDVGHVVVFSKLFTEVGFSSAGLTNKTDLKWLEATVLAELFLNKLDTTC